MGIGIISYGVYVPLYRLGPETTGWTSSTERAVANYDEDSITMAVAAAMNCMDGFSRQDIDTLYFASTTSPYREKMNAIIVSLGVDLRPDVFAVDLSNSLRSGTIALRTAVDAIKAGSAKQVLVVTSDLRVPQPRSEFDRVLGDGAVAFLIGDSKVAVEIEDSYSVSHEMYDVWRAEGDTFIRSWEDRFILEEGYLKFLPQAVAGIMKKRNLTVKDFTKAIFYAPDLGNHRRMSGMLGFDPKSQSQAPLFQTMGNTGTPFTLMMLAATLENAKPGDRLLLANYGDGADAFILRVTGEIGAINNKRGMQAYLKSKKILPDYETYTNWRGLISIAAPQRRPAPRNPSPAALLRENDKNLRLHGSRCKHCGYPQYPPQRVCTKCHTKDEFEEYRFSDKRAKLFTYTVDYLTPTLDPPMVISVADFEGGGRILGMLTDRSVELEIGMPLEMSFRKLHSVDGLHNYVWKCMPVRCQTEVD